MKHCSELCKPSNSSVSLSICITAEVPCSDNAYDWYNVRFASKGCVARSGRGVLHEIIYFLNT